MGLDQLSLFYFKHVPFSKSLKRNNRIIDFYIIHVYLRIEKHFVFKRVAKFKMRWFKINFQKIKKVLLKKCVRRMFFTKTKISIYDVLRYKKNLLKLTKALCLSDFHIPFDKVWLTWIKRLWNIWKTKKWFSSYLTNRNPITTCMCYVHTNNSYLPPQKKN